jgi:aminoglycoside 3-N-acetyltransferase I
MVNASPHIQQLTPEETSLMESLLDLFAEAFNEPETYSGARPDRKYQQRLLAQEYFIALTAVIDGTVVGGLVAYELQKFEQARSEIYIYDLAVAASHRRQGIATSLIRELQNIATNRGAWVIFIQADQGDAPAIALYDKLGSREEVLHFDIPVPPNPTQTQS